MNIAGKRFTRTRVAPLAALVAVLFVAGCATQPIGPSIMALPGSTKSFDQFRADDADCRGFATAQIGGGNANDAAIDSGVRSAIVGTAVGALAGAAIGGHAGAGVGAGAGLLMGSVAGANAGNYSGRTAQRGYDNAYTQCMYAKGEKVPMSGQVPQDRYSARRSAPPGYPPPAYAVPPPPGYPPPPPYGR